MGDMYLGRERRNRVVALVLAGVLIAGVVLSLMATVASAAALPAHAGLVSASPRDGEQLQTPPTRITLTFDEPVPAQFATVLLSREGAPVALGAPTATGTVLTTAVTSQLAPGGYRVVWRATTDDGHPISGASTFTLAGGSSVTTAPAQAAPVPQATPSYKTPQTQATSLGHPDHLPGLVVGGVLLLAGVALLLREHRRRRQPGAEPIS